MTWIFNSQLKYTKQSTTFSSQMTLDLCGFYVDGLSA